MTIVVIDAHPEPSYRVTCWHCATTFLYHRRDVQGIYVRCPVCDTSVMYHESSRLDIKAEAPHG